MSICSVDDCDDRVHAQRLCNKHGKRMRKYGTTDDPRLTVDQRFWAKVAKSGGCWLWIASIADTGYGTFWTGSQFMGAHRYSYELHKGAIPEGLVLDHLCRVRHCVNPDHLEPVTHRENTLRGEAPMVVVFRTNVCQRGHVIEGPNEYIRGNGRRMCNACMRLREARRPSRTKKREARP